MDLRKDSAPTGSLFSHITIPRFATCHSSSKLLAIFGMWCSSTAADESRGMSSLIVIKTNATVHKGNKSHTWEYSPQSPLMHSRERERMIKSRRDTWTWINLDGAAAAEERTNEPPRASTEIRLNRAHQLVFTHGPSTSQQLRSSILPRSSFGSLRCAVANPT